MQKKERKPREKKIVSEEDLVIKEANRLMTHVENLRDTTKSSDKKLNVTNTDLWLDSDFYFSVVFQSSQQKYKFLTKLKEMFSLDIDTSDDNRIQIINGLKFGESIGVDFSKEKPLQYPYPDLELRKLALDDDKF